MQNSLHALGSRAISGAVNPSLSDLGPGYKVKEFETKIFHAGEEIGIGNIDTLEPFIEMKESGMNFAVSCLVKRTSEIVLILLQDIEFNPS